MARLIIGHVTANNARIWTRGSREYSFAFLEVRKQGATWRKPLVMELEEQHFYTGVFELTGLQPDAHYYCRVSFGSTPETSTGQRDVPPDSEGTFKTPPAPGNLADFSFIFGSCNLHSINPLSRPEAAYRRISQLAQAKSARFMIHCGDQIYADIPIHPTPDLGHYRRKYLDAWDDCKTARKLLTELPHYMILDDHEIRNNFFNDEDNQALKDVAVKVYREFQHVHNPQTYGTAFLHYTFDFAHTSFFVMDTRTERYLDEDANDGEMIDPEQMTHLKAWLSAADQTLPKFIVSSIPFVGEVRRSKNDKWCSPPFLQQRGEIIDHIVQNAIRNVFFLTGDMHNSYHAQMTVNTGNGNLVIHELMSSPINQLGKSKRGQYVEPGPTQTTPQGLRYSSEIRDFYGGHSNVMCVSVSQQRVDYEIYRTKQEGQAESSQQIILA